MNPAGFLFELNFLHVAEEVIEQRELRLRSARLRDVSNPFEIPESNFKKMYRLPQGMVIHLLIPLIEPHLTQGIRRTHISTHIKVLVTLHFLAQGTYQSGVGKDFHLACSQPMVSRIINEITTVISTHLFPVYVKFPTSELEVRHVEEGFMEKFNFPNVVGAIDCTHVAIIAPPVDDPIEPAIAYLNRKGFYSINVQAICDANLKLLAINARYPGATHDAAIWSMSAVYRYFVRKFNERTLSSWLIGDSGYPLQPWLMTPIPDEPENTPEGRYTQRHCSARNVIERCFGVLKQRFRCLLKHRVLHYRHGPASKIIYSCAVLHNLCITHNIEDDLIENIADAENNIQNINDLNNDIPGDDWLAAGRRIRNQLINRFENE